MNIDISLSECLWAAGIILLIILFSGEPDLLDAIIYRLTEGKSTLPTP